GTEVLSPDGKIWACVDFQGTLWLIDVDSGQTIFEMKKLNKPDIYSNEDKYGQWLSGKLGIAAITFSSDGGFMAADRGGNAPLMLDVRTKRIVKVPIGIKNHVLGFGMGSYTFVGPDQIMLSSNYWSKDHARFARILALPSGRIVSEPKIPL